MLLWSDIESTDLDPRCGHLLEVALVVTDDNLDVLSSVNVICKPVGVDIDCVPMPAVVKDMHTKNGLIEDVKKHGIRRHEAEELLIGWLKQSFAGVPDVPSHECANCRKNEKDHEIVDFGSVYNRRSQCPSRIETDFMPLMLSALSQTPLAGSTISFDRGWLTEHMPALVKCWHYRNIDVSTITELAKRWAPEIYKNRPKNDKGAAHRALADVLESIEYLSYYRKSGFINLPLVIPPEHYEQLRV